MDSAFIHQAANELVQNAGTRNIKQIARSCSLDISETSRIKDMLGLLSLYFDKPLILINRQLDKQTKQMVCGYALGHYLEHQLLMDLHTLDKFLTIKDKHILLYEHNAFTSHLMLAIVVGRGGNDNKISIGVCGLSIQRCRQIQLSFCEVLLDIIIPNRRLSIVDQFNFLRNNINCGYLMVLRKQCSN